MDIEKEMQWEETYWEPDEIYSIEVWKKEVANDETRLGYWFWMETKQEEERFKYDN